MNELRPCVEVVTDKLSHNRKKKYSTASFFLTERELSSGADGVLTLSVRRQPAKGASHSPCTKNWKSITQMEEEPPNLPKPRTTSQDGANINADTLLDSVQVTCLGEKRH
jgi:hypothetical protein